MFVAQPELLGTNRDVTQRIQAKFYIDDDLWAEAQKVFDSQGVTLSEGMARLILLLRDAPLELRPVMLRQAPGDASVALAEHVLRSAKPQESRPRIAALPRGPKRGEGPKKGD